jgi:hypothetical protein
MMQELQIIGIRELGCGMVVNEGMRFDESNYLNVATKIIFKTRLFKDLKCYQ